MCITDGKVDCIINPISNGINNYLLPFINLVLGSISAFINFIIMLLNLTTTITSLVTGMLSSIFATNPYAASLFTVITLGISLIIYRRIYNLLSDVTIFGWKLPRL